MNQSDNWRFDFPTQASAFLWRSHEALKEFDAKEDPADLLSAALHLRLGIEARLFEYLDVALRELDQPRSKISQYRAQDLLARLTSVAPEAAQPAGLKISPDDGSESSLMFFTPVTKELAGVHARLGTFLHYPYFWKEDNWFLRRRIEGGRGWPTLYHVRDFVEAGIQELSRACSGSLLSHPIFRLAVEELVAADGAA